MPGAVSRALQSLPYWLLQQLHYVDEERSQVPGSQDSDPGVMALASCMNQRVKQWQVEVFPGVKNEWMLQDCHFGWL